jgi:hypothetical protein
LRNDSNEPPVTEEVMRKSVIALAIATLTCGTASAYLWQELRTTREEALVLQTRIAELEQSSSMPSTRVEPGRLEAPSAPLPEPVAQSKSTVTKNAPSGSFTAVPQAGMVAFASPGFNGPRMDPDMRRRMQENFEQQRKMLQDPEYRELMRSQQKMGMKHMYGDMESLLDLSREEAQRVLDVLAEQQLRSMEQRPLMAPMDGSPPDQAAMSEQQRNFAEMKRRNDAELAAVLGPKYSEWQDYQQNTWSRSQVTRLRESLAGSDEPLRQDQLKPLVQAMAREQQQIQQSSMRARYPVGFTGPEAQMRMQEEWLERTAQSHERIRNAVSSLLTPSQLQQLQEQQDQERKMQELNLRMQRARLAEAAARGEDPNQPAMNVVTSNGLIVN